MVTAITIMPSAMTVVLNSTAGSLPSTVSIAVAQPGAVVEDPSEGRDAALRMAAADTVEARVMARENANVGWRGLLDL
jgi:hypothetical protein